MFMKRIIALMLTIIFMLTLPIDRVLAIGDGEKLDGIQHNILYLVVGEPIVSTLSKQQIVIGINEGIHIDNPVLNIKNLNNDELRCIEGEITDESAILFEFNNLSVGEYKLISIVYMQEDIEIIDSFETLGIDAGFGVDIEQMTSKPDAYLVNEESEFSIASEEQAVVHDGGSTDIIDDIDSALQCATIDVDYMDADFSVASNKMTIVLDPGHGGNDGGASKTHNGRNYVEKNLNLSIAKYCKAELETYAGVTVYMTRSTDTYVGLEDRVNYAKSKGANVFISIHNNSMSDSGTHGAEVYYPNSNYVPSFNSTGSGLASSILKQLVGLGLADRHTKIRNANDYKYPDGSTADYYSVIRNSKLNGFPGIIIEHAYISNAADAANYLSSEDKLKKLGVADATGIAKYYGLVKGKNDDGVYKGSYTVCDGIYTISSKLNNNMVMDVKDSSVESGANVILNKNENMDSQKFKIHYLGNGLYSIINLNSMKLLELTNASKKSGANVQQYSSNGSTAQKWIIKSTGDGYYNFFSPVSGKAIDVSGAKANAGTNIQVYDNNGTNAQKFKLTLVDNEKSIEEGEYIIYSALNSSKAIDISGASKATEANVQLYQSNNTNAQRFNVKYLENGLYSIENINSKLCLDVKGGSWNNAANVQQYTANNTNAQKWFIKSAGDGYYYVISAISGNYLDVKSASTANGTNIRVYAPNGSNAQKFRFVSPNEKTISGKYYIQSSVNPNMALDISGASKNDSANCQLYTLNNTRAQQFEIEPCGEGYYTIKNVGSGKVLDVKNNSLSNGANVQQYSSNGTRAQKWLIRKNADETYSFIGYNSGKCLDITSGNMKNGSNIQIYFDNNTKAQKFNLIEI